MPISTSHNTPAPLKNQAADPREHPTPDQELLGRFLDDNDEDAFALIMHRHGGMVLGVCRRVLNDSHDAEDACQAVFLVLARKAASIRNRGSLASWLHGVAIRVAGKLHKSLARRHAHESTAAAGKPTQKDPEDLSWREVLRLVDEEVENLPVPLREPLVLCYLEGRTHDEAARELGWKLGVLRGRLERAREKLRRRLTRRGVTGASAIALATLAPSVLSAAMPAPLIATTAAAGLAVAAGETLPASVPAAVALLVNESARTPWTLKILLAAGLCLILAFVGVGLWLRADSSAPPERGLAPLPAAPVCTEAARLDITNPLVWCVAFSPDGKHIAAGSGSDSLASGELRVWDARTLKVVYAHATPRPVRSVAYAPDGKTMATAEHDGMARLRDPTTGDVLFTLQGHKNQIDSVSFSADGKTVATSGWDGCAKLWDVADGKELRTFQGHKGQAFVVTFGGPNGAFATGGVDRVVNLWRPDAGKPILSIRGHKRVVHWLAFAPPDGKILASASWDRTVALWDAATGQPVATLHGHTQEVHVVAFSPDGKTLASAACDRLTKGAAGEVIVWDVPGRRPRARFHLKERVFGLAFSPDGATLAATCCNAGVVLFKHEPQASAGNAAAEQNADLKFVAAQAQPVEPQAEHKKDYAKDFHPKLIDNADKIPELVLFGPDVKDCVKFEPQGLRITLPTGYPRQRPGTGVVTQFGVKGDFDITASFEILHEPNVGLPGNPTDLRVIVVPDELPQADVWHKQTQNRAAMARDAAGRGNIGGFLSESTQWDPDVPKDQWGNEIFTKIEVSARKRVIAKAKSGRIRLVRTGPTLFYYLSDGANPDYTFHQKSDFGVKDIRNVRLLASTGGPAAAFDVRVTDFHVRADEFIRPAAGTAAPRIVPAPEPPPTPPKRWLVALVASFGVLVAAVATLGLWLFLRLRRKPAPANAAPAETPAGPLVFACVHCGKRLKVDASRAGKKLKCPKCGKVVEAPAASDDDSEENA